MNFTDTFLLADDHEDDIFQVKRILKACRVVNPLHVVTNGEEVIAYLKGDGIYSDRQHFPIPSLIFLDLKMPFADGIDVLKWIKTQPAFDCRIIILTGASELRQMRTAYQLGAHSFLYKPLQKQDLAGLLEDLHVPQQSVAV